MSEEIQKFLGSLVGEDKQESSSGVFTLRSDRAREKLKKFALQHPENYFLLIIAGLHSLGGKRFQLHIDADDLSVECDCEIEAENLQNLWSYVLGNSATQDGGGLRLLSLSILTSVRFENVCWVIETRAGEKTFVFRQEVKQQSLPPPEFESREQPRLGTIVKVKRTGLKQVAERFLVRLKDRFFSRLWPEELLVCERVFLGALSKFTVNGKSLDCQLASKNVFAKLESGTPPSFFSAHYSYREDGAIPMIAILTSEEKQGENEKPRPASGEITWLWHGLRMGRSSLGLKYDFCQVFVIADGMQTDLSLSSISDTWDRQKAERLARQAVRQLLQNLVKEYIAQQGDSFSSRAAEIERFLLPVLAERIDTRRNRNRLASFNRHLIMCPLFVGSDEDGVSRRFTLNELWQHREQGHTIALFSSLEDNPSMPPWPGRPLVVQVDDLRRTVLETLFQAYAFESGERVLDNVRRLQTLALGQDANEASPLIELNKEWSGQALWQGITFHWSLDLNAVTFEERGAQGGLTRITRQGNLYFSTREFGLPSGLTIEGEFPWDPDYKGALRLEDKNPEIADLVYRHLRVKLSQRTKRPRPEDVLVSGLLWLKYISCEVESFSSNEPLYEPWAVVGNSQGEWTWITPKSILAAFRHHSAPCYYKEIERGGKEQSLVPVPAPKEWLLLPSEGGSTLESKAPYLFASMSGYELLLSRATFDFPSADFVVFTLDQKASKAQDGRLAAIRIGFPTALRSRQHTESEVFSCLFGRPLQTLEVSTVVKPVVICLDWAFGYPDSRATNFADQLPIRRVQAICDRVLPEALVAMFATMSIPQLSRICADFACSAWFELWTTPQRDSPFLIPTAGGRRVSKSELQKRLAPIRYFSEFEKEAKIPAEAVWLPGELSQTLSLLGDESNWVHWKAGAPARTPQQSQQPRTQNPLAPPVARAQARTPRPNIEKPRTPPPAPLKTEEKKPVKPALVSSSKTETSNQESNPASAVDAEVTPLEERKEKPEVETPATLIESLIGRLELLAEQGHIPHQEEFRSFLLTCVLDAGQSPLLSADTGEIRIREAPKWGKDDLSKQAALLSALYSVFNRTRGEVFDRDEHIFHMTLVQGTLASKVQQHQRD